MRIGAHLQLKAPLAVILDVALEPVVFNGSSCSPASSESWVVTVVYPEVCVSSLHNSKRRSAFVFSPCGEQEHTISTPQISAHTVSLLSYTPVTIHQFAITHTPFLCPPAATVVYALCPDESLSTAFHCGATPGRQSVCVFVCVGFVFFSSSSMERSPAVDDELLRQTVCQPVSQMESVSVTNIFKELEGNVCASCVSAQSYKLCQACVTLFYTFEIEQRSEGGSADSLPYCPKKGEAEEEELLLISQDEMCDYIRAQSLFTYCLS